jgi:outer membrane receptor for ferrienterochelin and colicins
VEFPPASLSSAVRRIAVLLTALAVSTAASAQAAPVPTGESETALQDLSLQNLLDPTVWVATKSELPASQTPAVVTVVTADEIQARGYTSLADVLRSVPGFYDVYDGVTHNVGIRGVNGGQNASGGGLKLMIDGLAVDFVPSTGNFFGEELIPIEAVERVEIIRGPASALYGADAFLGAINVITRSGGSAQGLRLIGQAALVRRHPGGGGGLVMGGSSGGLEVLLAASYLHLDRSGLALPASSPILLGTPTLSRGPSTGDSAEPASVLAKLKLANVLGGSVTFLGTVQRLDSHGEFQAFGPLDPRTRTTAINQNFRLTYDVAPLPTLSLAVSADHFDSRPTADARVGLGRSDYLMIPSLAASGWNLTAEGHFTPHRALTLTAGGDFLAEDSNTETYDQLLLAPVTAPDGSVLRTTGTIIPGEKHGAETEFQNLGAFVQGLVTPTDEWSAIAGLRLDHHNIYGAHLSARAGIIHAHRALSVKLLYGSSFKAPSPQQLYAHPVTFGGVLGNPEMRAQTAHSAELAVGVRLPRDIGNVEANGFVTKVLGRVEFLPTGSFVIANNTQDEWLVGGELTCHLLPVKHLRATLLASTARTVSRSGVIEGLLGKPTVTNPLFPPYQAGTIVDYAAPWAGLHLSAELSYVGPRSTSFSNALQRGTSYNASSYLFTALSASVTGPFILRDRETRLALRVSDALDQRWTEPGFGGVDVPTLGRTTFLTLLQAF